jgi:hypothetical protein
LPERILLKPNAVPSLLLQSVGDNGSKINEASSSREERNNERAIFKNALE